MSGVRLRVPVRPPPAEHVVDLKRPRPGDPFDTGGGGEGGGGGGDRRPLSPPPAGQPPTPCSNGEDSTVVSGRTWRGFDSRPVQIFSGFGVVVNLFCVIMERFAADCLREVSPNAGNRVYRYEWGLILNMKYELSLNALVGKLTQQDDVMGAIMSRSVILDKY